MKKLLFITLLALFMPCATIWATDGDTFTATTVEGVDVKYYVVSEDNKTCWVATRAVSVDARGVVTIPETVNGYTVTGFSNVAFEKCKYISSIVIPQTVVELGHEIFSGCEALTSIFVPENVTKIGSDIAEYCNNLTSIVVSSGNSVYDSRNNCNAIIRTSTNELVVGCKSTVIPLGVQVIGTGAFRGIEMSSLQIPETVTEIGWGAFLDCGITSIEIPQSVIRIQSYAFYGSKLTSIFIPKTLTYISGVAFSNCQNMTSMVVDVDNPIYDSRDNCNAIIETASNRLIFACPVSIIPNSITSIGEYAFAGVVTTETLDIPNWITSIGISAFRDNVNLTHVSIPGSVKEIGTQSFDGCIRLTNVSIQEGVETLGNCVFSGCGLKTLEFPTTIRSIGYSIFSISSEQSTLTKILFNGEIPTLNSMAFRNVGSVTSPAKLMVPKEYLSDYEIAFSDGKFFGGYFTLATQENESDFNLQAIIDSIAASDNPGSVEEPVEIELPDDEVIIKKTILIKGANVRILGGKLKIDDSYNAESDSVAFVIEKQQSLSLKNVVVDLNNKKFDYAFIENNGTLKIEDGVVYNNVNKQIGMKYDGAFYVNTNSAYIASGIVEMNNIALLNGAYVYISGGTLKGKYAISNQGSQTIGLYGVSIAHVNISGGLLEGTTAVIDLEGVMRESASVEMSGGKVVGPFFSTIPYGKRNVVINGGDLNVNKLALYQVGNYYYGGGGDYIISGDENLTVSYNYEVCLSSPIKDRWSFNWDNYDINTCVGFNSGTQITDRELVLSTEDYELSKEDFEKIVFTGVPNSIVIYYNKKTHSINAVLKDLYHEMADVLFAEDVAMDAGTDIEVPVLLTNERTDYTAYQLDVVVPQGMTLTAVTKNNARYEDAEQTLEFRTIGTNTYRIVSGSMDNKFIKGSTGALFTMTLHTDDYATGGDYEVRMKNILFSDDETNSYELADTTFTVNVTAKAPQPYAWFDPESGTLTFIHGIKPKGDNYFDIDVDGYPRWVGYVDGNYTLSGRIKRVVFHESFSVVRPRSMAHWFAGCINLTEIVGWEYLNTSEVTNMSYLFYNCVKLTNINIRHFVTSNVTTMAYMFWGCTGLTYLDLSYFNTIKLTDMSYMFYNCSGLLKIVFGRDFRTTNVITMIRFLDGCLALRYVYITNIYFRIVTDGLTGLPSTIVFIVPYAVYDDFANSGINVFNSYGDMNDDSRYTVQDLVGIVNCVLERDVTDESFVRGDLNGDNTITIQDAILVIDKIFDATGSRPMFVSEQSGINEVKVATTGDVITIALENTTPFTAFQFDFDLPEDVSITGVTLNHDRSNGHHVAFNKKSDGKYVVVVYSTSKNVLKGETGTVLMLQTNGMCSEAPTMSRLHFISPNNADWQPTVTYNMNVTTGIEQMKTSSEDTIVYQLDGTKVRIQSASHGIFVVNGKKVVR